MATMSRFAQASQRLSCLSMRRGHATFGNTRNFRAQPLRRIATRTVEGTVVEGKTVTKSSEWTSDKIGRALLGGASLVAVGSLCYYGLGLSGEEGAIDRAMFWPAEIRSRINTTYAYFAGGLGTTAAAAYAASRSQPFLKFMVTRPIMSGIVFLVGTIGSAIMCYAIPYSSETIPIKMASYGLFTGIMGATLAPIVFMGGPLVARAAMYTAGVVGALSATAACAPSQKYLNMSGPLSLGLGVVFVASIGGLFAAPGTALFSGLHAIYMYGGLVLFGGFLLYDTQKIIHCAENRPQYDPVNMSIGIYLDTINIFIRILYLLAGSSNRRK